MLIDNDSISGRKAFPAVHKYLSAYSVLGIEDRTTSKTIILISP